MDRMALICRYLNENPRSTQRELAQKTGLSLGTVNTLMKECIQKKLIAPGKSVAGTYELTGAGDAYLEQFRVDGALIVAAGFGSRFVPLTYETPKGLLEVFGERMIERQIRQLHEAGVTDITIAVGYLKEKFDYLIDKYQVKLLYNPEYTNKNTLATMYHARKVLQGRNMYVLCSDHWIRDNMFHAYECGSWYSSVYMKGETSEWVLSYNKKGRITDVQIGGRDAWVMYGPVYLSKEFSDQFLPILVRAYHTPGTEQFYWEHVLMEHLDELDMEINCQPEDQVYEFENLEELRQFDTRYQTRSDNQAMELLASVFDVPELEIWNIRCLKSGMTNHSFLFRVHEEPYICRIPGPGAELLINRKQEALVYETVQPLAITEDVIYLDPENGYKISRYYEDCRCADPDSWEDMSTCMSILRRLHNSGLTVPHSFDLRERIGFYEHLCLTHGGIRFEDYDSVRRHMEQLLDWIDGLHRPQALTHIDSNVDNFLFLSDGSVRLIDWEYTGMCDPILDIAMSAIYVYYTEEQAKKLAALYFEREPELLEWQVIQAYMALGGFLWTLWALYKEAMGDEFGEYTLIMYRYAKDYYKKLAAELPLTK